MTYFARSRLAVASATFAMLFPTLAPAGILKLKHEAHTLPNGLRVFFVRYPSPGAVAYQVVVRAGSRNEIEKGKTGFAHFFEHLMFRGTQSLSAKEFGSLYVKLGCENNAWTSYDMTNYHGTVAEIYLPQILRAEADRFAHLSFDEKALREEAGAVVGEMNKSAAQPDYLLEEKLMTTAFHKHAYGHTVLGHREDILKFTERYQDVWPFFRRHYRPENVFITLVGDFDFKATLALIRKEFGPWKLAPVEPAESPVEPVQAEPRKAEVQLSQPAQTRIVVAYKIPPFSTASTDNAALELLSELALSIVSPFQKEYRFGKKWLDSVWTDGTRWMQPGLWQVWLRFAQAGEGKDAEILAALDQALQRFAQNPPPLAELRNIKKRFRNQAVAGWFASPGALSATLTQFLSFETDLRVLDRVLARIDEVTPAQISQFARRQLIPANRTIAVLKGAAK